MHLINWQPTSPKLTTIIFILLSALVSACSGSGPSTEQVKNEMTDAFRSTSYGLWDIADFKVISREDVGGGRVIVTARHAAVRTAVKSVDAIKEASFFDIEARKRAQLAAPFKEGFKINDEYAQLRIIYAKNGDKWVRKHVDMSMVKVE